MIDYTKPFDIKIEGLTKEVCVWVELVESPASIDLDGKDSDEIEAMLEEGLDQFNNIINRVYKDKADGYVQLGNTSINIRDFAAIRVSYSQ